MGRVGKQPQSQILPAHRCREAQVACGNRKLEPHGRRHRRNLRDQAGGSVTLWRRFRSWLQTSLRRSRMESEMDAELQFHIATFAEDLVRSGVPRDEALRRVRIEFGGIESAKEECREARGISFVDSLVQDLRFGTRVLRKNPGFATVAILTLALGIGANTAVFTVVNGVLLQPMPFPGAARLFLVSLTPRNGPLGWAPGVSDPDYLTFQEQDKAFEQVASFSIGTAANLTGAGDPAQIPVSYATAEFFPTLRTNPAIGRGFVAGEGEPGRNEVVVLSDELWKERFASDPGILGKIIQLDGVGHAVIGVMPPGFAFPGAKAWMPLAIRFDGHNSFTRPVVGRLKPDVLPQQAKAEVETFAGHLPLGPGENERMPQIIPLRDLFVAKIRPSLVVFTGAVSFVLLIACANVASLFLVRAAGRGQEMAVRSTLGAGRWRLVRQLLTESTVLSLVGGVAGLLLAFWGVPALLALAPAGKIPRTEMVRIDGWVLAFTFGISTITGMLFGLAPAFQVLKRDVRVSLCYGGH